MKKIFIVLLVITLTSCSPTSNEEIKKESQKTAMLLIEELKEIKTRDDIVKKRMMLKKRFDQLASLMIEAERFGELNVKEDEEFWSYSDELKKEMIRIYEIDGGQVLIESYQKNALRRLSDKNISH
jgi:hypothetical protein